MLILVLYIIITTNLSHAEHDKSPLCKFCGCQPIKDDNSDYEVICLSKLHYDIFDISFWKNETADTPYKFSSLTIHNNVFGYFAKEFPSSELLDLNLAKNAITSILVSVFKNLNILEVLILSNNEIEVFKTNTSEQSNISLPLPYLKTIRLDHNKLRSLNPEIFKHSTILQILDLSNNPIHIIDNDTLLALTRLSHLKELYLQNTGIKVLPENMLQTLKSLQIFDISGNSFETVPSSLADAQSLTHLYMNDTGIKKLTYKNTFPNMLSLKTIHFCHNEELVFIGEFCFGKLKNIENVRLSHNLNLPKIDPYAFAEITNDEEGYAWLKIKKLYLQYNNISYLKNDSFGDWEHLEELDIRGNPWICDCGNQWLIDDLYPRYLNINEVQANSLRCTAPEKMVDITFQELYRNKTRLKCPGDDKDTGTDPGNSPASPLVPAVIGFSSGFLVAIPIVIMLVLGYQRKLCRAFKGCGYERFQPTSNDIEMI